jgi:hypothetical protein
LHPEPAGSLALRDALALAQANFLREEDLWKKRISAEQEYLEARRAIAEANVTPFMVYCGYNFRRRAG